MYAVRHSSQAHPSLTKWYAMALDFFLSVDAGAVVLAKTDWLSLKTKAGLPTVIPIIRNLNVGKEHILWLASLQQTCS